MKLSAAMRNLPAVYWPFYAIWAGRRTNSLS